MIGWCSFCLDESCRFGECVGLSEKDLPPLASRQAALSVVDPEYGFTPAEAAAFLRFFSNI